MWSILWITVLCVGVGAERYLELKDLFKELILTDIIAAIDPERYNWVSEVHSEDATQSPSDEQSGNAYHSQMDLNRGLPGVDYPNYTEIPQTSFTCSEKSYLPGFYADMDTDCQVFHVCWPHRRESFLCPIGTTFSQPLLACDYWYRSNCSLAPYYYDSNAGSPLNENEGSSTVSLVDFILEKGQLNPLATNETKDSNLKVREDVRRILKLLPVKAKVVIFPEDSKSRSKIVAEASMGKNKGSKARQTLKPEDLKPGYTLTHAKHSQAPFETQTSGPKVKGNLGSNYVNRSVVLAVNIFDRVLDLVRGVLKDVEELRTEKAEMVRGSLNKEDLARLKQSFMSKPDGILNYTKQKSVLPTEMKEMKSTDAPTREVKPDDTEFLNKFSKRQSDFLPSEPIETPSIYSSTLADLIENYIRLYKRKLR